LRHYYFKSEYDVQNADEINQHLSFLQLLAGGHIQEQLQNNSSENVGALGEKTRSRARLSDIFFYVSSIMRCNITLFAKRNPRVN
jgi:hypothetical protein